MNKTLLLVLTIACGAGHPAWAQTGTRVATANPMPDGSHDAYVGLGVQSAPRWEGSALRKVSALPLIQVEWSSGVFISGLSLGMHLSSNPALEYGPLLALQPGRSESGTGGGADGIGPGSGLGPLTVAFSSRLAASSRLAGMDDIPARLLGGGFVNYYVAPAWRLTGNLLAGAGKERDGARLELGVQRLAAGLGEHHRVSLSAGVGIVNRAWGQAYFGVTPAEAARSRFASYAGAGGLQDAHAGARWNWDWTPSLMLSTNLQAKRLLGGARASPLVERPVDLTVSAAVAYRF